VPEERIKILTPFRLIARLDVKPPNLVKTIQLEGLRKIGDPIDFANKYYESGIDEIQYQDVVASLYGRNTITELVRMTASDVFIPISVGGGIRSVHDAAELFKNGADRVLINSGALIRPQLISEIASSFGSQAVCVGIETTKVEGEYKLRYENGRQESERKLLEWISEIEELGAGEIIATAVENEGMKKGFDLNIIEQIRKRTNLSLIIHGGASHARDLIRAAEAGANGAAIAGLLHYGLTTISQLKSELSSSGIEVRK
jgi:cyclase